MPSPSKRPLLALFVLASMGCTDEPKTHAPFCYDADCLPSDPVTVHGAAGAGGADDGSGTSGTGGLVTVTGQVVDVDEPNFAVSTAATASGTFTARTLTTASATLESTISGSLFSLDNVLSTKAAWLTVTPTSNADYYPSLVVFNSSTIRNVTVPAVRKSALELVSSVLTTMTTIDTTKAQAVLRFVDTDGKAVSGVTVALTGAEKTAYDLGAGYTDDATKTSARGLVFLFNIDASESPSQYVVRVSGTVTGDIGLWLMDGAAVAEDIVVSVN